jgi:tRNA dimethylallyltransferase
MILLYGPTGVGKSDLALLLAQNLSTEIVNMDVGQFYTPLTIGTAKPAWRSSAIPHHMFDILNTPTNYTIVQYRTAFIQLIAEIRSRGNTPLVVGGSGFYLKSLLFPPVHESSGVVTQVIYDTATMPLWEQLQIIDPERAAALQPHDTYRITRALDIWHATQIKPSLYKPRYSDTLGSYHLVWVTRDRQELYDRINARVCAMFAQGWVDEVRALDPEWITFILQKKIIGYNEIVAYRHGLNVDSSEYQNLVSNIQQRTRHYARRQAIFWRMLERALQMAWLTGHSSAMPITTINMSSRDGDRNIKNLLDRCKLLDQKG